MVEPLGKLKTALSNLIIDSPFFASLALRLELIESLQYETLATDGVSLHYNPDFVNSLTRPEAIGVLAHEASHCAFRHHTRRGERDPQKWNIAADYAINGILIECGFTLPEGVLIDNKFKGKDAEFIYSQLPDNPEGGGSQKEANGDSGGGGASQTAPKQARVKDRLLTSKENNPAAHQIPMANPRVGIPVGAGRFLTPQKECKRNRTPRGRLQLHKLTKRQRYKANCPPGCQGSWKWLSPRYLGGKCWHNL